MAKSKSTKPRKNKKSAGPAAEVMPEVLAPEAVSPEPIVGDVITPSMAEPAPAPPMTERDVMVQVGFAAGKVWQALQNGPLSLAELGERIDEPETILLMAVGWLARENKLVIIERGPKFELSLTEQLAQPA